jgi:hypothetical protein
MAPNISACVWVWLVWWVFEAGGAGRSAGLRWGLVLFRHSERRPWSHVLVNGGHLTVALVVILGGWREQWQHA